MMKHSLTKDGYLFKCKACNLKDRQKIRHIVTVLTKVCCICGIEKNSSEFSKNPRSLTGLGSRCKECSNKQRRDAKYYLKSNKTKKLRLNSDPIYREYTNKLKKENLIKNYGTFSYLNAKRRAKKRGLEFNLDPQDIIIPKECPILHIPIILGTKGNYENTPSIDRIDNSKGYTKDNIQIISKKANSMKNSASAEELLAFADWVYLNFKRNSPNSKEINLEK